MHCNSKHADNMTWRELRLIAKKNGYHFVSHGKKHDKYENPETKSRIMIERHWSQEVRPGLLKTLKKEIGF